MVEKNIDGMLWRLEHKEKYVGERKEFYSLINQMWLSEQIPESRMNELIQKYPRFEKFFKS